MSVFSTELWSHPEQYNGKQKDCLCVEGWENSWWNESHIRWLIWASNKYKIKCLSFSPRCRFEEWKFKPENTKELFAYHLESIDVKFNGNYLPDVMSNLMEATRVRTIRFILIDMPVSAYQIAMYTIAITMETKEWLLRNYSVRTITFKHDSRKEEILMQEPYSPAWKEMQNCLERNRNCVKRCQTACTIFLAKKLRKEIRIGRDVCQIITAMIWETRGGSEWKPK